VLDRILLASLGGMAHITGLALHGATDLRSGQRRQSGLGRVCARRVSARPPLARDQPACPAAYPAAPQQVRVRQRVAQVPQPDLSRTIHVMQDARRYLMTHPGDLAR
jgi:hypothetical protein